MTKQHHMIEIFSANCPLCKHITDDIEIGECEGCKQIIYDVNNMTEGTGAIAIHSTKHNKLITALWAAVEKGDGSLDKDATSHDDCFDTFRMSLQYWH